MKRMPAARILHFPKAVIPGAAEVPSPPFLFAVAPFLLIPSAAEGPLPPFLCFSCLFFSSLLQFLSSRAKPRDLSSLSSRHPEPIRAVCGWRREICFLLPFLFCLWFSF